MSLEHRRYEEGKGSKAGIIGVVSLLQSLLFQAQGLDYLLQDRNGPSCKSFSWAGTQLKAYSGGNIGVPLLETEAWGQT